MIVGKVIKILFFIAVANKKIKMILSDKRILEEIENGNILIEPFKKDCLGTNSYDVHLGRYLGTYKDRVLDAREHNKIDIFEIPVEGIVIQPNTL